MHLSRLMFVAVATATAAIRTSIWINQIPAYSALAPCAENRVSAIVRGQSSGCGDDDRLISFTSFSCFCIDRSSQMASIISTAVEARCSAQVTRLLPSLTAPLPEVTAALAVFNSYCARSTELAWYAANSSVPASSLITPAPSSTIATSSTTSSAITEPSPQNKSVPVAAIAAPVVIGVLVIAGVVGLLFYLRRRKAAKTASEDQNAYVPRGELGQSAVDEVPAPVQEMVGDAEKYRHELGSRPAELEGGNHTIQQR